MSRREVRAVAALAPPRATLELLGFYASRTRLLAADLASYRAVHLATQGRLDSSDPALSGLLLSRVDERARETEGFVGLHDVPGLRLEADLVVLSGCRTALGREVRGEGLQGLVGAFLYAGSSRVPASLWRVEDRAAAELMERFYRHWWRGGLRPSEALAAAQRELRRERRFRDPVHWAGWVLVGDWR